MHRETRELKKEDAAQVACLIYQLTKNIVCPEKLVKRIEELALPGNWQYFVVAQEDASIIAFGGVVWYPIPSKGMMGMIEEVVVDEAYRGQHQADAILYAILHLAEKKRLAQVKLTTGNLSAKSVYERFGFTVKQEQLLVKKYY